jgi:hypothetical protein
MHDLVIFSPGLTSSGAACRSIERIVGVAYNVPD